MGSLTETLGTLFAAYGSKLGQAIVEHTIYVLISVAIGFALAAAVVSSLRLSQTTPVKKRG